MLSSHQLINKTDESKKVEITELRNLIHVVPQYEVLYNL